MKLLYYLFYLILLNNSKTVEKESDLLMKNLKMELMELLLALIKNVPLEDVTPLELQD
jgi:hypothetical protein